MSWPTVESFCEKTGLKPDTRVLISRIKMPENGGRVAISPDALGRPRHLIFVSWGTEERAIDLDRPRGGGFRWRDVEDAARKLRASTIPIYYDGPADSVPPQVLVIVQGTGEAVLWRPWREGPWRPYATDDSVMVDIDQGDDDEEEGEGDSTNAEATRAETGGVGDLDGDPGTECDGGGGSGPGPVD